MARGKGGGFFNTIGKIVFVLGCAFGIASFAGWLHTDAKIHINGKKLAEDIKRAAKHASDAVADK